MELTLKVEKYSLKAARRFEKDSMRITTPRTNIRKLIDNLPIAIIPFMNAIANYINRVIQVLGEV